MKVRLPLFVVLLLPVLVCTSDSITIGFIGGSSIYERSSRMDEYIMDGVNYFTQYVNNNGGILNNWNITLAYTRQVGQENFETTCDKFVKTQPIDLLISPYGTEKTELARKISMRYNKISFGTSGADLLFDESCGHFSVAQRFSCAYLGTKVAAQKIKTYSIFTESLFSDPIQATISYMTSIGAELDVIYYISSPSPSMNLELGQMVAKMINVTNGRPSDLLIAAIGLDYFESLRVQRNLMIFNLLYYLTPVVLFNSTKPNGWLTNISFMPRQNPQTSIYGGTSQEFYENFKLVMKKEPTTQATLTVANLMAYWAAVIAANSTDSALVRPVLCSQTVATFFGTLQFVNGSNNLTSFTPVQYLKGRGVVVNASTLVYPVTFPDLTPISSSSSNSTVTGSEAIALLSGIVVGSSLFAVLVFSLALQVLRRQRNQVVQAIIKAEEGERRVYKIDFESLEICSLIGMGYFGYVYKGVYRGAEVAVKKLKQQVMTKQEIDSFLRESSVMVGLRHPNILLFMGVCTESPERCIVTELLPNGSLHDVLHDTKLEFSFQMRVKMALDILKGLVFIHLSGFIHRDLKSPNLLVDKDWNVKIADFGLSCAKFDVYNNGSHISLLWTAPEILRGDKECYTEKSDVYSFGIVLWELMTNKVPFESLSTSTIMKRVVNGKRPPIDPLWDQAVLTVMESSWANKPADRNSIREARQNLENITFDEPPTIEQHPHIISDAPPLPPSSAPVTLVFIDIQNSSLLWEAFPLVMASAMRIYNQLVHNGVNNEKGYEVANSGSAYVIAFPDAISSINFCLRLQVATMTAEWPDRLKEHTDAKYERVFRNGTKEVILRGLRVRMGVHTCSPTFYRNPLTRSVDYGGPGVAMSAQLIELAQGGQILLVKELQDVVLKDAENNPKIDPHFMESFGHTGIGEIFQLVPKQYEARLKFFKKNPEHEITSSTKFATLTETRKRSRSFLEQNPWVLNVVDITIANVIGYGSYGGVHYGSYQEKPVAVKFFTKQTYRDKVILEMRGESSVLCKLNHPNIIKFIGLIAESPNVGFVTEFVGNGNLAQYLYNRKNEIAWQRRLSIAKDTASGMIYLHELNIINRDLKSSNILLTSEWTAKIGDFGFNEVKLENQSMTQCGTIAHAAPEIFKEASPTDKSDVFSFGIILWELVFRKKPWEGSHTMKIMNSVEIGLRPSLEQTPPDTPIFIINLMQECWHQDPSKRPSFRDIVVKLNTSVP